MNNKPITLEERKLVQLEMLKEIDLFCRSNNIRYSLAFGTLLGAIRHNGFIPWDDDVDIMMPLPDMIRFKELFHSETMKYLDINTYRYFEYGFSRITNTKTYRQYGIIRSYGISIDLYPLVSIPENEEKADDYFRKAQHLEEVCDFYKKWRSRMVNFLPLHTIPFYHYSVKKTTKHLRFTTEYGKTNKYYIIAGPIAMRKKMTYYNDIFDDLVDVVFEGNRFWAISKYDMFLTMRYGDYMTPPPIEQRHPYHGGNYYWK